MPISGHQAVKVALECIIILVECMEGMLTRAKPLSLTKCFNGETLRVCDPRPLATWVTPNCDRSSLSVFVACRWSIWIKLFDSKIICTHQKRRSSYEPSSLSGCIWRDSPSSWGSKSKQQPVARVRPTEVQFYWTTQHHLQFTWISVV